MWNRRPCVWIISGPSGSGKTTLTRALLKDPAFRRRVLKSVSCTTRPRRASEKEGKDYFHLTEPEFRRRMKRGAFLEHEKIFGYFYGTPKAMWAQARRKGRDLLLCIDVKGAGQVKALLKGRAVSVFVMPSGIGSLRQRLRQRSTENSQDMARRLARVKMELSFIKDYDYVVLNDDFDKALADLKSLMRSRRCKRN